MQKEIHPDHNECEVNCVCGNKFTIMSNETSMKLDICSKCHPFFTGEAKLVDRAGRVDKFKKKYNMQ